MDFTVEKLGGNITIMTGKTSLVRRARSFAGAVYFSREKYNDSCEDGRGIKHTHLASSIPVISHFNM